MKETISRRLSARALRAPAVAATVALVLGGGIATASTASAVSVAPAGQSSVIAAQGPFGSLDFYWQTIGTKPWNRETVAGPGSTFSAPSVAQVGGSSVIAAEGPNHTLEFYWQTIGTKPWNSETVAGPGTTYSAPHVAQVGNSSVIAAEGPNHRLDFYWQTIGTAPWNPETVAGPGSTYSAPSVSSSPEPTSLPAPRKTKCMPLKLPIGACRN